MDSEARFADQELDMLLRGVQDNDKWVQDILRAGFRVCCSPRFSYFTRALGRVGRVGRLQKFWLRRMR